MVNIGTCMDAFHVLFQNLFDGVERGVFAALKKCALVMAADRTVIRFTRCSCTMHKTTVSHVCVLRRSRVH